MCSEKMNDSDSYGYGQFTQQVNKIIRRRYNISRSKIVEIFKSNELLSLKRK